MKERLTVNSASGLKLLKGKKYVELLSDKELTKKALNRLAEYEDLEEQGLIVRLPCKVGGKLYNANIYTDRVEESSVARLSVGVDYVVVYCDTGYYFDSAKIGNYFFYTKAEAEKKLKELKGEE